MALFKFFKKKTTTHPPRSLVPSARAPEDKKKEIKKPKEEEVKKKSEKKVSPPSQPQKPKRKATGVASLILKSIHITEKATDLARKNQYVFKVSSDSSKQEVKKAVEEVYGVNVLKVRQIRVKRKRRRLGKTFGWRKGYKKAIVTLKQGQKIEILPR